MSAGVRTSFDVVVMWPRMRMPRETPMAARAPANAVSQRPAAASLPWHQMRPAPCALLAVESRP